MMQEELLNAIGGLDETILAESEGTVTAKPKRILWRVAATAATVALLAIGVAAAAAQFRGATGDPIIDTSDIHWKSYAINGSITASGEATGTITDEITDEGIVPGIKISMPIDTNEDAPIILKTPYMLQVPDHWVLSGHGNVKTTTAEGEEGISQFSVSWEPYAGADGVISSVYGNPEEYGDYAAVEDTVSFRQRSASYYNNQVGGKYYLDTFTSIPSRVDVTAELATIGEIPVLKVAIPAFDLTEAEYFSMSFQSAYMAAGEVHLYWSDGDSIMSLTYPAWMTDDEIAEILSTIYVVEDLESMLAELSNTE